MKRDRAKRPTIDTRAIPFGQIAIAALFPSVFLNIFGHPRRAPVFSSA
jgi:hypothetical protein